MEQTEIQGQENANQQAAENALVEGASVELPMGVEPPPSFDDDPEIDITTGKPVEKKAEGDTSKSKSDDIKYNPLWNTIKDKLGEGYNIPEPIVKGDIKDPEQEFQMIVDTILENAEVTPDISTLPDLVQEYLYLSQQEGFDEQEWLGSKVQQQNIMNTDSETFMTNYLNSFYLKSEQNPKGTMTSEQIKDTIEKMKNAGTLDITAANYKRQIQEYEEERNKKMPEIIERQKREHRERITNNIKKDLTELRGQYKDVEDVAGVRLGKAEIAKAIDEFEKAVLPDEKTGIAPIQRMMQSNNFLFESFVLTMYRNGDLLKEFLTGSKELTKERIFEKLRGTPKTGGSGSITIPSTVDPSQLV
jgi:hypothetical protein